MKRLALLWIALLLAAPSALGDEAAWAPLSRGCAVHTLCAAEADAGPCKNAGGTSVFVANLRGIYGEQVAYTTKSTATTYSCDIYTGDNGYSATHRKKVNSSSLTNANPSFPLDGLLKEVWGECPTITGGNVTMDVYTCPR